MQIRVPKVNLPRVVIVGGGFGGIELAKRLKNKPFQIVLPNKKISTHLIYAAGVAGVCDLDSLQRLLRVGVG